MIRLSSIEKRFGTFAALDGVSLEIERGELLALLGPSGGGKTTLLRLIAGLEAPDRGAVCFEDRDVTRVSPSEREVGFVFQQYALFREMTVFENVAFGLRVRQRPWAMRFFPPLAGAAPAFALRANAPHSGRGAWPRKLRPSDAHIRSKVVELLAMVQLDGLAERYPDELSGGQRQRVAVARAIAVEPKILLLDEPFGALDANVRRDLRSRLRDLHDDLGVTTVFVTHDQEEAFDVADRIAIVAGGTLQQIGTPEELLERPANDTVATFLGTRARVRSDESGERDLPLALVAAAR